MLKKSLRIISLIIIPLIITTGMLIAYDKYLDEQISMRYNSALGRTYGVDEMNKGIKLLEHNAQKGDLIILGSSELDAKVPQNPQNMFPNSELDCDVNLVGRAAVQSLLDTIKVGALEESFGDKKIVLIVSLQWFLGDDIDQNGFKAHFSEVQFYKFINVHTIYHNRKLYVCERIQKLLKNDSIFEQPYLYAYLYKKDSMISNIALTCMKPYYHLREKFLELQDKHLALKKVKEFENYPIIDTVNINWENETIKAEQMGKDECTNNNFYVYDEYYTTYLANKIDDWKNSSDPNLDLCVSKEFDDYEIFLKICKDLDVQPYIVFMSTNGFYYDYIGIGNDKRIAFYDKLAEMTNQYGFDYLDLRDHEYEPYFYKDVMHLGWKGWLYVNEKITKYYSQCCE